MTKPLPILRPTDEQLAAVDLFGTGQSLAIQAGAGTGKTSTLRLLAEASDQPMQYVAFNKAIVTDAGAAMPGHVTCSTAHSLAFRAVGKRYSHRINGPRMKSLDIARMLKIDPVTISYGSDKKVLAAGFLAGHVIKALRVFCQTADDVPTRDHIPYIDGIDVPTADGRRTYAANNIVRAHLAPVLAQAWADIADPKGQLPFDHGCYLKLWQLEGPRIGADVILFDEAQDANPVMVAIVAAQEHAQVVWVGDSQQAIYEFTGAVDALDNVPSEAVAYLSRSFRFGPAIAEVANKVLVRLGSPLVLEGAGPASVVGPVAEPDAILCRTNAAAVNEVLSLQAQGRDVYLVGGGEEVVRFARGVDDLRDKGWTSHPDLTCFSSWGEVQDYVEHDPQGSDLALMVKLIDEFGTFTIRRALERMIPEASAEVVVSTAHKAKGREWDSVQLGGDFPDPADKTVETAEWRLMYVAATRARRELDISKVPALLNIDTLDAADELPPVIVDA